VPIILGIDPGSRITGYGLINANGNEQKYLTSGSIVVTKEIFPANLREIFIALRDIMQQYAPTEVSIEKIFVHANVNSALKLGQARGAALAAISSHNSEIILAEYSPRQIKQAIVGFGGAVKQQMQHMIKILLRLEHDPKEDEADALAIALCHANMRRFYNKINQIK
jgi:crossover junction endodeoxyribonuclease RuvC